MSERAGRRQPSARGGIRLLLCALLGTSLSASVGAQQKGAGVRPATSERAERRVALVIGNSNYEAEVGRLKNPANDAGDVAAALQSLGFEVVGGRAQLDVNLRRMDELVRDFGREIRRGGVGVFYFSGHGLQVTRVNYPLPLGSRTEKEQDVPFEAFNVDHALNEMEAAENRLNILILGACRNNPLTRGFRSADKGLTRPENVPIGKCVAFAARDGQVASDNTAGRKGLYTQELLKNLVRPGLRLEDIFINTRREVRRLSNNAQTPVEYGSIDAPFYFIDRDTATEPGAMNASPSGNSPAAQTQPYEPAMSYRDRGHNYYKNKEYARAVVAYTRAICLVPRYAAAYNYRGNAYHACQDYDRAIADQTKAIELDSSDASAYNSRGSAYFSKGDYDRAIADYTRAVELSPKYVTAYRNRAHAYEVKGDRTRAAADRLKAAWLEEQGP